MLTKEQRDRLMGNIPKDAIRTRKKTDTLSLSYVDGSYVVGLLAEVFDPDGYDVEILETRLVMEREEGGKHRVGYLVKVELGTRDVEGGHYVYSRRSCKQDYGYGSGVDRDQGGAHESAIKEAVTDAVKRCARYLGWAAGLALYDKSGEHVGENIEEALQKAVAANENGGAKRRQRAPKAPELSEAGTLVRNSIVTSESEAELESCKPKVLALKGTADYEILRNLWKDQERKILAGGQANGEG